jgi:hypothetical protein
MFVPTWFVPLEHTRMQKKDGAKLIEMSDLQWEFFFTCWKYNLEFYRGGTFERYKYSMGVPIYYYLLGRRLFGDGMKYPLYRFAGFPESYLCKHLYLDFSKRRRDKRGLKPISEHIVPGFETIKGLNMVDASTIKASQTQLPEPAHAGGD